MADIVSVRVPHELKREMDRLKEDINWSQEIREFIKKRIEEYKKREVLEEVVEYIKNLPEAPKGTVQQLVREDRDSH